MFRFKNVSPELFDLHCHVVPYVDDGAEDLEEAKKLITEEYCQGVRLIVATVHLRCGMFDTSAQKVKKHFDELKCWLSETEMNGLKMHISREYYCDDRLETLLDAYAKGLDLVEFDDKCYSPKEEIIPFGSRRCILLEFSSLRYQKDKYGIFIKKAIQAGLTPIVAHIERYQDVQNDPQMVSEIKKDGAYIQINCDSLLGRDSKIICETAGILMKDGYVDIVCSDSHDMNDRIVNMKKCYSFVRKKYGAQAAKSVFCDNAKYLIGNY